MKLKYLPILSVSCFLLAFLLMAAGIQKSDEALADRIAPDILRFHVLANSDSKEDQQLKLEVRTLLLDSIYAELGKNATKEDTCTYLKDHKNSLEVLAQDYMKKRGYDYSAGLSLTRSYFPTKTYGDMVFPCGTYDAAKVVIGEGSGRNWWCVLYPPLCFVDAAYAVVPDTSKETLQNLLTEDDYQALLTASPTTLNRHIRFKFIELMDGR